MALATVLLVACVEDAGMVGDLCGPIVLPMEVVGDVAGLDGAIALWNDRSTIAIFDRVAEPSSVLGLIEVETGYCPEGIRGLAYVHAAHGEVLDCRVVLDVDVAWHEPTAVLVLAHELGHCLGLADDPPSLDLGSIMSSPVHEGAEPTDLDLDLVLEGCP